ncbi:MAG: EI24 domain-containing protein [Myxococcota bacterium]
MGVLQEFWLGFRTLFTAFTRLTRLRRVYPYALVPALVFVALEAVFALLSTRVLSPWVRAELAGQAAWQNVGATAVAWLSVAIGCIFGWFLAALLTPPLSAPALERIVALVEADLGMAPRRSLGLVHEFLCGLRASALGLALFVPPVFLLTVLELIAPPVAVVTTPVKLALGALGVSWSLLDYPLTLRGTRARARLAFVRDNAASVLGFGCAFALCFWLPCCGILLLPVGVAGATELLAHLRIASSRE